jgi:uncharacterized protein
VLTTDTLVELQAADTATDQLNHRSATLPELGVARQARADLLAWERRSHELRERLDVLTTEIETAEHESEDIDRHRTRLEAQLRTVIAPREAEALQHEIATLEQRRSEIDDRELAALEEQAALDDTLVTLAANESSLREQVESADAGLAVAQADIAAELAALDQRRTQLRAELDPGLLSRYDRLRSQLGVAVARLVGARCEGCHLDMSPAELDAVKRSPADELAECPQCNRMLVR